MGLFSRKRDDIETVEIKNAVNVNNVDETSYCKTFSFRFFGKGKKNFGDLFFYTIIEKIFAGLRNVSWRATDINYTADEIVNFIDANAQLLVHHYWKDGYACIITDKLGLRLPYANELRFDSARRIVNRNAVVVYSDPYVLERKTHYMMIMPYLEAINGNCNNSDFVTNNLGLFGILSGKGIPISPAAKDELQATLKKKYGAGDDKFQFIMTNTELDYKPIEIPVDQLKLNENTEFLVKQVCRFFGINPDYLFGGSTFSNQAEAVRAFYKDVVVPLAETLLQLARSVYIKLNDTGKPSTIITYDLSNVGEFNTTLSENCAEKTAYLDYLLKLREAGIDVSTDLKKLYEDSRRLISEV